MKPGQRKDVPLSESRREVMVQLTQISVLAVSGALSSAVAAAAGKGNAARVASPSASFSHYLPMATGTTPKAFNPQQFAVLTVLVERMIPRTDTPGAADAGVHWYIDGVAAALPAQRERLRRRLDWLDAESTRRFGKGFVRAHADDQIRLLTMISDLRAADISNPSLAPGRELFHEIKLMTIRGYFQSQMGMMQELHWVGNQILAEIPGCPAGIPSQYPGGAK